MFEMVTLFGLYNNMGGLALSYMMLTLPFTIWVLTAFMRDLPKELEEAAIMDGASPWTVITKVYMPLMWPALVTTGLLAFIAAWNGVSVRAHFHADQRAAHGAGGHCPDQRGQHP